MKMSRWLCIFSLFGAASAMASGGGGKEIPEGINYIPVTPALIVNYGGPGPRVKYIKAELSIRAENATDAKIVMHHLPLIRDRLIHIFSTQSEETLSSVEGKEKIRLLALEQINAAIHLTEFGEHAQEQGHTEESPKKDKKEKGDKSDKKSSKKKSGDDEKAPETKAAKGPASDLFFNNFVVQK